MYTPSEKGKRILRQPYANLGGQVPAQRGDTVSVYYSVVLDDGTVHETNRERAPLLITLGEGDALPAFEEAVIGLEPGGSANVRLEPDEAYGPRIEEVVEEVPIELFGEGGPIVGDVVTVIADDGSRVACLVTAISEDLMTVTVDFNHPLAGTPFVFEIELVDIIESA